MLINNIDIEFSSKENIDKKLLRRIRLFVVILVVMTGVLVYEIFVSDINVLFILLGIIIGIAVGFVIGRILSIEWHTESRKVIARLDFVGIIVLVVYITLSLLRHWIFAHWFACPALTAITVSFIEGVMLGRILSLRFYINKILVEHGKSKID
jgi:hypothetical protein